MIGKDSGKEGKITHIFRNENKVIIEGINMVTKHVKPSAQNENGGIIKAQRGVKTNAGKSYYSTVFQPNFAHILEGLGKENSADYANWLNGMQDKHYYLWNNIAGGDAKAYGDTAVKDIKVGEY